MKMFKGDRHSRVKILALLLGTGAAIPAPVLAQQGPQAGMAPTDEIVVTAQKRVERIIDVPMSITAASGDQLVKQGISNTSQLTKLVPGFSYQESNYGTPVFSIRGVGFIDYTVTANPTVTAYVDQVPLSYSVMTRGATLDLERVEVLKGPQGTLFGQNSTGGAVNYIAAKPTNTLRAGIDLSYGRFNEVVAGAFVSGPITDTLRARVAVRSEYMDGWQKSLTRPGDTLGKKRFYNGRLLVDWDPSENLKFEMNLSAWQDKSETPADQLMTVIPQGAVNSANAADIATLAASPTPTSIREADWDADGNFARNDKFYLASLRADWTVNDQLAVTSITAFSRATTHNPVDLDGSAARNFRFLRQDGLLKSFSQELRLGGDMGPVKWMLGGNYQRQTANAFQLLDNPGSQGTLDLSFIPGGKLFYWDRSSYISNQRITSKSVFASLDYAITDQITFRASARYNDEHRKFNGCLADGGETVPSRFDLIRDAFSLLSTVLSGSPTTILPGGCLTFDDLTSKPALVRRSLNEDNISWRATADWKPNGDTLIYATISRGYKSGSFTIIPSIFASQLDPVTQESLLAYEAGFKLSLAERKVQISGSAFYYDYTDKQLLGYADTPFGRLPKLLNIPKSWVKGFEIEATVRPVEGLRMTGGVSHVLSRVKEDPSLAITPLGTPTTFVGQAFPNTPKWQFVGDAEYGLPVSGNVSIFIGGGVSARSKSNANFGNLPQFILPSYALIDLRAGAESADGKWRAQLYGRNITNKWYWQNVFITTDALAKAPAMGATYGLALTYRY